MSRTDKDAPYEVRVADPTERMRYWNERAGRWDLHLYPCPRPPRLLRRAAWSSIRSHEQVWRREILSRASYLRRPWLVGDPPDLPERMRHAMLWAWW